MKLKLIKLTKEYELKLGEMIDEWKIDQEMITQTLLRGQYLKMITMILTII